MQAGILSASPAITLMPDECNFCTRLANMGMTLVVTLNDYLAKWAKARFASAIFSTFDLNFRASPSLRLAAIISSFNL